MSEKKQALIGVATCVILLVLLGLEVCNVFGQAPPGTPPPPPGTTLPPGITGTIQPFTPESTRTKSTATPQAKLVPKHKGYLPLVFVSPLGIRHE